MTKPPTWTLTCDEFDWVWRQETRFDDAYDHPDPLAVRTTPTTETDADKLRTVLRERFPRGGDRGLSAVFTILSNADTRVASVSTVGNSEIRSHGAALDGLGVVAAQHFTPNEGGGDVRLALVSRALVPAHLSAILPKAEPGGAGPMLGYTPRVRGEVSQTHWTRDAQGRLPVDERIRTLMRKRRSAEGYFVIERDPGTRPIQYLSWIDIPPGQYASGRYLIEVDDNDTTITPASPTTVAREISKRGHFHAPPKRQDDR
ncbi:ESX secretion-associated protein EspG [Nocardia sp. NPDC058705]|uniref:ESX secretion-associated protein EspG n=1 Tax=Nocardia sp. NPDC058705 TaxID=3346609 RepID=UPI0036A28C57